MVGAARPDGRRARSRQTRARIIDAASILFVRDGYVTSTIEAIADVAGVATQTVYYVFGTKAKILTAVLEHQIVGDLDPVPLAERDWVDRLAELDDGNAAIELLVAEAVTILSRVTPIHRVIQSAAADPEVGDLLTDTRRRRRVDQRRLVELISGRGLLRADLDVDVAADVFYALVNEEVFDLLVNDCGWEVEQFRSWATTLVRDQLTGSEPLRLRIEGGPQRST